MGRKLTSYNGNDCIYTPIEMARKIVNFINPKGCILEPCRGDGAFTSVFDSMELKYEWCEIQEGIDFFDKKSTNANWMITNPPFSKVTKFLKKTIELGIPNIALLVTINSIWMNGKLNLLKDNGYQLKEIHFIESPYFRRMNGWKQSGFSLGVLVIKKDTSNTTAVSTNLKTGEIIW